MANVYACADLHGCYWAWERIRNTLNIDDRLYFLGDAIDRGPDGVKIMRELLADERVIYLMGNHEKMMIDAYQGREYTWTYNGNLPTVIAMEELNENVFQSILAQIAELPYTMDYINTNNFIIHLSHSGYSFLDGDLQDYIWNRTHYYLDDTDIDANEVFVHGHTPIPCLQEDLDVTSETADDVFWYCNGHKCDIDCGTVWSGVCALLNLDTFESIVFYQQEDEYDLQCRAN